MLPFPVKHSCLLQSQRASKVQRASGLKRLSKVPARKGVYELKNIPPILTSKLIEECTKIHPHATKPATFLSVDKASFAPSRYTLFMALMFEMFYHMV